MTETYYHAARKAKSYPDILALFVMLSAKFTIRIIAIKSYEAMRDDDMNLAEGDEVLVTSEQGRLPCKICSRISKFAHLTQSTVSG